MEPEFETAPVYPVGERQFLCVEYPGIVKNIDRVLETLGGEKTISQAYANRDSQPLELRYRPKDPFCHAINGSIVPTSRVLVKVTRRRRKDESEDQAQMTTQVVGTIPQTCRFRGMADFQYLVPKSDSARKLRTAIMTGDAKSIQALRIPLENDKDQLHSIPPPIFSMSETPFKYDYKQNAPVVRVRVQQPDGTYVTKLVNKSKTKAPRHIVLSFESQNIPTAPPELDPLTEKVQPVKEKLVKLFDERPIWSKFALRHCLDSHDNLRLLEALPHIAYSFQNGPWRDCWVKYGVDPRTDQSYAVYQQVDIRIGHPEEKSTNAYVRAKRTHTLPVFSPDYPQRNNDDASERVVENGDGRIFDGQTLPTRSAWYQVCDITDPDFDCILRTTKYQHATPPTKQNGYFYPSALIVVRSALRQKIKQLNDEGHADRIPAMDVGLDEKIAKDKEKSAKGITSKAAAGIIREHIGSNRRSAAATGMESDDDDDYDYNDDEDDDFTGTDMMDTEDWN